MQLYHNHVVFQSFSDLYFIDEFEKKKQERRRQALAAIDAAAAMSSVQEQYALLRSRKQHGAARQLLAQLTASGLAVHAPSSLSSSSSSASSASSHSPCSSSASSRAPSLHQETDAHARRSSCSSVDTAATSVYDGAEHRAKAVFFTEDDGDDGDDQDGTSYPAALFTGSVTRRLRRKEADTVTLEDQPGVAGLPADAGDAQGLSLRRF